MQTTMKLYYTPAACSQAVHIIAVELGIGLELIRVNLRNHQLPDGSDFHAVNPKGYVPMLVLDDGRSLTEGSVILQYLADLEPGRVAPACGSWERWKLMEMLGFISTEIHKGSSLLWNPSTAAKIGEEVTAKLHRSLGLLETELGEREFIVGSSFSIADAYLFVLLNWMRIRQFDLAPWPALVAYREHLGGRSSIDAVLRTEGLRGD